MRLFYYRGGFVTGHSSKNAGGGYSAETKKNGWQLRVTPAVVHSIPGTLPASTTAAVKTASTVRHASAVEPTAASAMESSTTCVAASVAPAITPASVAIASANVSTAAPVSWAAIPATTPATVIPRTGPDEYPIHEKVRPVESVRRARIRVVVIISIRTDR